MGNLKGNRLGDQPSFFVADFANYLIIKDRIMKFDRLTNLQNHVNLF